LPFLGYFFNEPAKSSLIGEKSPNLVTLLGCKGTTSFHGTPVHGLLIHGTSLHGILVHGNDTFSACSCNDMVHGMLHSLTTNVSGASPA
jgi:hypothetical protein